MPGKRKYFLFLLHLRSLKQIQSWLRTTPCDKVLRIPPWDRDFWNHLLLTACSKAFFEIFFLNKHTHLNEMNINQLCSFYLCQSHFSDECLDEYRSLPTWVPCLPGCLCIMLCWEWREAVKQTSDNSPFASWNRGLSDLALNSDVKRNCATLSPVLMGVTSRTHLCIWGMRGGHQNGTVGLKF